jgi:hypothetical protein
VWLEGTKVQHTCRVNFVWQSSNLFDCVSNRFDDLRRKTIRRDDDVIIERSTGSHNKRSVRATRSPSKFLKITMDRFIRRENVLLYRLLLAETNETKDQVRHALLMRLLEAELTEEERSSEID